MNLDNQLHAVEQTYGPYAFGLVAVILLLLAGSMAIAFVWSKVIRPYQDGQQKLAQSRVDEAKAMSMTAMSLDNTARELRVTASTQKDTAETQRATTEALERQIGVLTQYQKHQAEHDRNAP